MLDHHSELPEHEFNASTAGSIRDIIIQLRYQKHLNLVYGVTIYIIFFTVVITRGIIIRTRLRRILSPSSLIPRLKPLNYPRNHIQSYTFAKRYGITIPTFSQLGAIGSFGILLIFFASYGYQLRDPSSPDYVPDLKFYIRYFATRTGVLSFVLLPLLILTAGRMNILVWATQWSFDSWNIFHRFIGRMSLFFAILHTIAYLAYVYINGNVWHNFQRLYWNCGFIALALFLVLSTLPSVRFIRTLSYEVFLVGHILATLIGLITLFYHTLWHFANEWLYLTVACWALERLSRVFKTTSLLPLTGTLTNYNTTMRLDVYFTEKMTIRPGYFAHLRFPQVRYVESHPFSIAASMPPDNVKGAGACTEASEWTPLIPGSHTDTAVQRVSFLIRPYDGMTRSLQELLLSKVSADSRSIDVKLYFEGPYGQEHHVSRYSSVILLAGGVGVTFTLPYLLHWKESATQPRMRFLWIIRSYSEIDSALDLLQKVDEDLWGCVQIFYTGPRDEVWNGDERWRARITFGRPCIADVMRQAILPDEEMRKDAYLGVFACGPGSMLDQCRINIDELRLDTKVCIDYIEEASTT